jgi:pimeloyl-ACP methyl ester carboxylesterase
MMNERYLEGKTHTLRIATGPEAGPPLLFLHGVCRRWQDFLSLIPALTPRWQIHGLDFRGHGGSDHRPGQYRVADYVEDALAVLHLLPDPAVIYGHSLGALVAAATAAAEPDRVRAIVLEDPPSVDSLRNIGKPPFHAQFTGMRSLAGRKNAIVQTARDLAEIQLPGANGKTMRLGDVRDPASLRFLARCLEQLDPDVLTPLIDGHGLDGYDVEAVMRGVRCPALLLRGDDSSGGMISRAEAETWAGWMTDGVLIDFPGIGHLIHGVANESVLRVLVPFLESIR